MGKGDGTVQRTRRTVRITDARLPLVEEYSVETGIVLGPHPHSRPTSPVILPSSLLGSGMATGSTE